MRRIFKKSLLIAAIFIPIGIALLFVGLLTGARSGVYIGSNGKINIGGTKDFNYENYEFIGVKDINVDVSNARIIIKESDNEKFGVIVNLTSIVEQPTIEVEDGLLKIQKSEKGNFNMFSWQWDFASIFDGSSNEVVIYVPKEYKMNEATLVTSNGRIEIEYLSIKDLEASTSNGKISVENVKVSGDTTLTTSNGEVKMKGSFSNTTYAKSSNGKIIGEGIFIGKTTFKTSNGSILFKNSIHRGECNIVADTSNGTIRINGSKVRDDFSERNGATNSIDLDTSNGSITIDFE